MDTVYRQLVDSQQQEPLQFPALNFASDSLLAQQVGASELLCRLRDIIVATDTGQKLVHDEPNRIPELLALIHTNAVLSYTELMCSIAFS